MSKRPPERLSDHPNPKRTSVGYLKGVPGQVGSFGTHQRGPNGPPPIGSTISVQSRGNQIHQQTNNTGSIPIMAHVGSNNSEVCLPGEIMFVDTAWKSVGVRTTDKIMSFRALNKYLSVRDDETIDTWAYLGVVRQAVDYRHGGKLDTQLYSVDVYGRTNVRNVFRYDNIQNGDQLELCACKLSNNTTKLYPAINGKIISEDKVVGREVTEVMIMIPIGIVSNAASVHGRHGARLKGATTGEEQTVETTKQLGMIEMLIV